MLRCNFFVWPDSNFCKKILQKCKIFRKILHICKIFWFWFFPPNWHTKTLTKSQNVVLMRKWDFSATPIDRSAVSTLYRSVGLIFRKKSYTRVRNFLQISKNLTQCKIFCLKPNWQPHPMLDRSQIVARARKTYFSLTPIIIWRMPTVCVLIRLVLREKSYIV